ncbi:MAG: hypothetical protein AAF823_11495 [Planctomycetota bacterium]
MRAKPPAPARVHTGVTGNTDSPGLAAMLRDWGVNAHADLLVEGALDGLSEAQLHAMRDEARRRGKGDPNRLLVRMLRDHDRPAVAPPPQSPEDAMAQAVAEQEARRRQLEADKAKAATPEQRAAALQRGRGRAMARNEGKVESQRCDPDTHKPRPPTEPTDLERARKGEQLEQVRAALTPAAKGVA